MGIHDQPDAAAEFLAYHDVLTGLPNRTLGKIHLQQALVQALQAQTRLAVLFVDMDHFKQINNAYGYAIGDKLLQAVAARLCTCLRMQDHVCRLSADEFMIVLAGVNDGDPVTVVCERLLDLLSHPFDLDGTLLCVSACIGVALLSALGPGPETSDTLMRHADIALHAAKAKHLGGAYRIFEEQMSAHLVHRQQLRDALRAGLERDEFVLHYQPQIDLRSGALTGVEALIRWQHPDSGLWTPSDFIAEAEASGLIVPIGRWVLHEVCRQAKTWGDVRVAVNLSVTQFHEGDLAQDIAAALSSSGLRPEYLELEITESLLLQDDTATLALLEDFKRQGLQIALDDFGTGYSSLSYLHRFNFDKLKIDRSFVTGMQERDDARAIVQAMIAIAHSLGMKTIAEGVEDIAVAQHLRAMGCDEAQGFLYARPMPGPQLVRWLHHPSDREPPRP